MAVINCSDKEGNESFRDIVYKCTICGEYSDTYEDAIKCLHECAEEEYGLPSTYERLEDEDVCLD